MGKHEAESWYSFSIENFEWDFLQGLDSIEYVTNIIKEEAKLLDNDYTRIFVGGFSGGGVVLLLSIFLTLEQRLGAYYGMSSFPTIPILEIVQYKLKFEEKYRIYI